MNEDSLIMSKEKKLVLFLLMITSSRIHCSNDEIADCNQQSPLRLSVANVSFIFTKDDMKLLILKNILI